MHTTRSQQSRRLHTIARTLGWTYFSVSNGLDFVLSDKLMHVAI